MDEFIKTHFKKLSLAEVAQISDAYQIYSIAEYISDTYPEIDEKLCIELAYDVRRRMDKYDCSESDAIDEVMDRYTCRLAGIY